MLHISCIALLLLLFSAISAGQETITEILYSDHKPVSITFDEGIITAIERIEKLPEEIRVFYKVKGPERTIITSDVTGFGSLPPGKYVTEEGDSIELTKEGMLRYPAQNVLYGSASPLKKGVRNVMKVTGCSLEEAIQMASTNPARLYGLYDRGGIAAGKRADIILFRIIDDELIIKRTYVSGNLVYDSENQ